MATFTDEQRQFLRALSYAFIAQVAPHELSMFDDLAEDYFRDPTPRKLSRIESHDEPLGAGVGEVIVAITTAAFGMASTTLTYVRRADPSTAHNSAPTTAALEKTLSDPVQREELQKQVYATAISFHLPSERAARAVAAFIRTLDAQVEPEERVINVWIAEQAPNQTLQLDRDYALSFNVAVPRTDALTMLGSVDELASALLVGRDQTICIVDIETDDFIVSGVNPQMLIIPQRDSSNTIAFPIRAKRTGVGHITAFFALGGQVFQRLRISLLVGQTSQHQPTTFRQIQSSGWTIESALRQPIRQQNLSLIVEYREMGYQLLLLTTGGVRRVCINISPSRIAELVGHTRNLLHDIVYNDREQMYRRELTIIPRELHTQTLKRLSLFGRYLYDQLFYSGQDESVQAMGNLLRDLTRTQQFNIQIIADRFIFPWALLDTGQEHESVDIDDFWGFRHLIACMPVLSNSQLIRHNHQIVVNDMLHLAFVHGESIDDDIERFRACVDHQREFFDTLPRVAVSEHTDKQSLITLLRDPTPSPHIIYTYCHAHSFVPGDMMGVSESGLDLNDGTVTVRDLDYGAPRRLPPLKHAPLVILNACETAKISLEHNDGLIPYMLGRGARGVLGAEVDIPTDFAMEFALDLFRQLIGEGIPLGECLLNTRRRYALDRRNVLGLLYTLYSNNEIVISYQ